MTRGTTEAVRSDIRRAERLARYHWIAELCSGKRVLHLACGLGDGSLVLLEGGAAEVTAVDSATAMVEVARSIARPKLRFEDDYRDVHSLPAGSFDVIVCLDAHERREDPLALVLDAQRLLADDGTVALAGPSPVAVLAQALADAWPHVQVLEQRTWLASAVGLHDWSGETREALVAGLPDEERPEASVQVLLAASSSVAPPSGPVALVDTFGVDAWLSHDQELLETVASQREHIARLSEIEDERRRLRRSLIDAEREVAKVHAMEIELRQLRTHRDQLLRREKVLEDVLRSPSWRLTEPLRLAKRRLAALRTQLTSER